MRLRKKKIRCDNIESQKNEAHFCRREFKQIQNCNEHDTSLLNAVRLLWNKTFMIMQLCTISIRK